MKALKRAAVGGNVQIDATGTNEIVFGVITKVTKANITMKPSDGSKLVVAPRAEFFKATAAEVKKFAATAPSKDDADQGDEITDSRSIVPQSYRAKYKTDTLPTGRKTLNNGDSVAKKLSGKTLDEAYSIVAKALKVTAKSLVAKWGHLNNGQQRMLLGNALRHAD